MGKPVYRRIFKIPATTIQRVALDTNIDISYMENVLKIEDITLGKHGRDFINDYNQIWRLDKTLRYYHDSGQGHDGILVIMEYTKITDVADFSSNEFQSYLHYIPSSSQTKEVITKDLKNLGIQFLEDYTYDSTTNGCVQK